MEKLKMHTPNKADENFKKLEQLYSIKESELEESKKETDEAKRYNKIMMIIAGSSLVVAILSLSIAVISLIISSHS